MSAIERVSPVEVNGIEFYVSASGKESGLSVVGVSKLAGISPQHVSRLVAPETMPKWLESLQGELFHSHLTNLNGSTKTVATKVVSRIIRYYAYEAKQTNQTAKDNFDKFSEVGLHTWVLHMTGFKTTEDLLPVDTSSLGSLKALIEIAQKYYNQQVVLEEQPGLKATMDSYSKPKSNVLEPTPVTLKTYLADKGIQLDKRQFTRVAQVVAETYKNHNGKLPGYKWDVYVTTNGKKAHAKVYAYRVQDYPVIDSTLELLNVI